MWHYNLPHFWFHFFDVSWENLDFLIHQKFNFVFFVCFSIILSFILSFLAIFIRNIFSFSSIVSGTGLSLGDTHKRTPYECGFEPFEDARNIFQVQFYLVGILFLVFDLEVAFLFPWVAALSKISFFGFWSMMFFLIILIIGFAYEWKMGALEWE